MRKFIPLFLMILIGELAVAQNVGIGTNTPLDYAKLDIESTSSGLMLPRLSDAEMSALGSNLSVLGQAISAQYNGLMIYNTDDFRLYVWDTANADFTYGGWKNMLVADDLDSVTLDDAYNNGGGLIQADNGPVSIIIDGIEVSGTVGAGAFISNPNPLNSKMIFNPRTAAFRAGYLNSTWALGLVGDYSAGFGYEPEASGDYSFAVGESSRATGSHSIAMGNEAEALSADAIAIGDQAEASGLSAITIGDRSSTAGSRALAIGANSIAQSDDAFAFTGGTAVGRQTVAGAGGMVQSDYGIAIGDGAQVGSMNAEYSVAIGQNAQATGRSSYALGNGVTADGLHSTAMGYTTSAAGDYATGLGQSSQAGGAHSFAGGFSAGAGGSNSFAYGDVATAIGDHAIAIGDGAIANSIGSIAIGTATDATGQNSTAIGHGTMTLYDGEAAFGKWNVSSGSAVIPVDQVFSVGVGSSSSRQNAITVLDGGLVGVGIGGINPTHVLEIAGDPTFQPLMIDGLNTDNLMDQFLVVDAGGTVYKRYLSSFDGSSTNELQTLSRVGTDVTLSNGGGTVSIADNDNNSNNELQSLSIAGSTISLSNGGGSVTVPSSADNLGNHSATTTLAMNNNDVNGANSFIINDPGDQEGVLWKGTDAKIFVSPLNSGNSDGYLRIINDGGVSIEPGTEDTEEVIIESNGNVGLGLVPTTRLDIGGNIQLNDNNILGGDDVYVNDIYNDGEEDAVEMQADLRLEGSFVIEMPNNMEYSQTTSNQDFTSGYGNVRQVSIDVKANQKVLLHAHIAWDHDDEEWVRFRFYRNGSAIGENMEEEEDDVSGGFVDNTVTHCMWVDEPGAGTHTYSIRMDGDDNTTKRVYNVSIVAMVF